uniref:His-Xaa-Ser system protein HxsD n=1 Tax=Desulfobacca acetoxidans TaxID=60893 RepID=A0A7V4G9F8_9BACT
MSLALRREPGRLVFELSKSLYEKEAVLAAVYALSGVCRNRVEPVPEGSVTVTLELIDSPEAPDLDWVEHRFLTEIVDQQLRLELERRYGGLRQLIVQHAFSPLADLRQAVHQTTGRD